MTQVKGSQPGLQLSNKKREKMLQLWVVTQNKREVARLMSLAESTVHKHIKEMLNSTDPDIIKARKRVMVNLAGKTTKKANMILDSITEEDLESGLIKTFDGNDKLVRVQAWGPSLLQKVTAGAIMTDKIGIINAAEQALGGGTAEGEALMPASFEGLLGSVKHKIKELTMLNVKFEDEHKDLSQRVQDAIVEAEIVEEVKSHVVVENLDDFDGNE